MKTLRFIGSLEITTALLFGAQTAVGKAPATTPPRPDDVHEGCSGERQMPADDTSRGTRPSGAARQISPV